MSFSGVFSVEAPLPCSIQENRKESQGSHPCFPSTECEMMECNWGGTPWSCLDIKIIRGRLSLVAFETRLMGTREQSLLRHCWHHNCGIHSAGRPDGFFIHFRKCMKKELCRQNLNFLPVTCFFFHMWLWSSPSLAFHIFNSDFSNLLYLMKFG